MLVGPLPTPAIAFLTQSMRADAGIVAGRLGLHGIDLRDLDQRGPALPCRGVCYDALQAERHPLPDPAGWAEDLGISAEAVELYLASEVIDLHVDAFIWHRLFGYDLARLRAMAGQG